MKFRIETDNEMAAFGIASRWDGDEIGIGLLFWHWMFIVEFTKKRKEK